jgi:putative SOS response-associated peptidase YedK
MKDMDFIKCFDAILPKTINALQSVSGNIKRNTCEDYNMCFDISFALKSDKLEARFSAKFEKTEFFEQVYHVSAFTVPNVPVITNEKPESIQMMRWGLIPFWVKDDDTAMQIRMKTFNARSETIFEKPSFRHAIKKNRCLVLVDGFYEWRLVKAKNYPYFIHMADEEPFALAGIWDVWHSKDEELDYTTFSVITTKANPLLEKIHNKKKRMPAILRKKDESGWLNPDIGKDEIYSMLKPIDDSALAAHTVSKMVSYKKENTNVPEVREKHDYEDLKFEQTSLF